MGKDYTPLKLNGYDLKKAYDKIKGFPICEAENIKDFYKIPTLDRIEEIEIGDKATATICLRLKDGSFCVLDKTIDIKEAV